MRRAAVPSVVSRLTTVARSTLPPAASPAAALLAALLASVLLAGPATAAESCHTINAKGAGQLAERQDGDADNVLRTVAQIRGGGILQGTTAARFASLTGPPVVQFTGDLTFTTNRGTLTIELDGSLVVDPGSDVARFEASGPVVGSTGKLAGASGSLTLSGEQDLADPQGSFTETVVGTICVDLAGNGGR